MKDTIRIFLKSVAMTIFILIILIGIAFGIAKLTSIRYNNGRCHCGGYYQLVDKTYYGGTRYYIYECNECGDYFKSMFSQRALK